ncbi:unnamed protein product, partial [Prunus brigantina]
MMWQFWRIRDGKEHQGLWWPNFLLVRKLYDVGTMNMLVTFLGKFGFCKIELMFSRALERTYEILNEQKRVLPHFEVDSAAAVAIDEKIASFVGVWGGYG